MVNWNMWPEMDDKTTATISIEDLVAAEIQAIGVGETS